jgi:NAD(P)-dependent dehydrogenase (short-subunit alcohol dehydrogenase family)
MKIDGSVALVTGAGRGLGRVYARPSIAISTGRARETETGIRPRT